MERRTLFKAPLAALQLAPAAARVYAYGDGIPHTPEEYARLLTAGIARDDYSRGGIVETLETRMAALLGKEAAVWMPTGTLANHLAVRLLAGQRRRVLVQADSHLFNDCGDCAQTLSGLHLVPLAPLTLESAERASNDAALGRVPAPIGALQIETPVRRRQGERFDFGQLEKIGSWARARGIGMHLDGARLFVESAYTARPVKAYAARFDTVYVSLYKYFNAASGAILAGPKMLLDGLYHTRRMFGGGLNQVWPFAAVALHYLDGFEGRFAKAVETSEAVIRALGADSNFEIERIGNGTNIFKLRVHGVNAPVYQGRLEAAGISARVPTGDWFSIQVNETWARVPAAEIAARFRKALG